MNLLHIFRFTHLLSTGLLTGILFGDRWGTTPIRPTLPASCFTQFQQGLHVNYVPLMPILLIVSILSGLISMALLRRSYKNKDLILTAIGTLCIVAVFVLTRIVNVPINNELMTWQISAPPQNWLQIWMPWEQAHTVRTVISVVGFVCLLIAVTAMARESTLKQSVATDAA